MKLTDREIGLLKRKAFDNGCLESEDVCILVDEVRRLRNENLKLNDLIVEVQNNINIEY